MSSNVTISEVKASNSSITSETAPRTAVFIGATAGIGKATLTRLVAQHTAIKVYLVGRNAAKHQAFVDQLRESNSEANIIFLEGEVSLMAEVQRICNEIKAKDSSIDAVFLSTGYIPHSGRESSFTPLFFSYHCQMSSVLT
jgi:NAD(P)-dependent dehydrogenase (short-subunit alcohol dehydrogenase family)